MLHVTVECQTLEWTHLTALGTYQRLFLLWYDCCSFVAYDVEYRLGNGDGGVGTARLPERAARVYPKYHTGVKVQC